MSDITITFEDGKQHVYSGAPDTLSPGDVYSRAQKDFPNQKVKSIDRKTGAAKADSDTTYQKVEKGLSGFQKAIDPYEAVKSFGERGAALGQGLVAGVAGLPGAAEQFLAVDVPSYFGQKKQAMPVTGRETLFPTKEEILQTPLFQTPEAKKYPVESAIGKNLYDIVGGAGLLKGLATGVAPAIKGLVSTVRGTEAAKGAEELRGAVKGLTEAEIATQAEVAQKAQADLDRISAAQRQIAERDAVAAERAARQAGTPPEAMADIRSQALARTRDRVADAQKAAREAGLNEAETVSHIADVEGRVTGAEDAIRQLEQRLASGEQITPEQFGSIIREATANIRTVGEPTREKLAGFGQAIVSAGERPIVDTTSVIKKIDRILKNQRDASIINTLNLLKKQLTTTVRGKEVNALNIASTDSLRKSMDRILTTKTVQMENGMAGDAAAAVHHVAELKNLLLSAAQTAHKPYGKALSEFKRLSRPLDIVSRKGELRDVLDVDSLSKDYLLGSAEVAGRVIQRARDGHPVFTRLMAENPEIQNGARAFFNRELFGAGRVPNADTLRSFVQKNEGVLKQLGIYDEFKTVASARASGQAALDAVKAELTQAKAAQKGATKAAREAEKAITGEERLRGLASSRLSEAEKIAVAPEKIATESEKRAAQAESRLAKLEKEPTKALATAEARQSDLSKSITELEETKLADVANKAKSIISDLREKLIIDDTQYKDLLRKIEMADNAYGKTKAAQTAIKTLLIGGGSIAAVAGEQALQRTIFGNK
jgi:hypothetical protein